MWFTWLRPEKPITTSKPTFKITRSIRSEQVLNAFVECYLVADGAYDKRKVYDALNAHSPDVETLIPPRKNDHALQTIKANIGTEVLAVLHASRPQPPPLNRF